MDWEKELNLERDEKVIASWAGEIEKTEHVSEYTRTVYISPRKGDYKYYRDNDYYIESKEKVPARDVNWKHSGVLVLTNRQLVFLKKHGAVSAYALGKKIEKMEWWDIEDVVDVSIEGTWRPSVTIHVRGYHKFWLKGVGQSEFEPFRQLILGFSSRRKEEIFQQRKEAEILKEEFQRFKEDEMRSFDERLRANPTDATTWCDKGQFLYGLERLEEAISCYDEALKIDPDNAQTWNDKGIALYKHDRPQEALECFNRAFSIDPNVCSLIDERGDGEALKYRGDGLSSKGKFEEAGKCYHAAAKKLYFLEGKITYLMRAREEYGRAHDVMTLTESTIYGPGRFSLPIALKDERESTLLTSELAGLITNAKLKSSGNPLGTFGAEYTIGAFSWKTKKQITLKTTGENRTEVIAYRPEFEAILKKTILGRRLQEYWISKDGISTEEASKRLEKLMSDYYGLNDFGLAKVN